MLNTLELNNNQACLPSMGNWESGLLRNVKHFFYHLIVQLGKTYKNYELYHYRERILWYIFNHLRVLKKIFRHKMEKNTKGQV